MRSYECGCVRDTERFRPILCDRERDDLRRHVRGLVAAEASAFTGAETYSRGARPPRWSPRCGLERYHPDAVHHTC